MAVVKLLWLSILSNVLKGIMAKDNECIVDRKDVRNVNDSTSNSSLRNWQPLKYQQKIIRNVYIVTDYDAEIPTNNILETPTLTLVSYEIGRFYVENIDEMKRTLSIRMKMKGTWLDSRIKADFSGTNRSHIMLPTYKTKIAPFLWIPLEHLRLDNLIHKKNNLNPKMVSSFKLSLRDSWFLNIFPPKSVLVSADVDWSITISCNNRIEYSDFPHDSHDCDFIMRSNYVNGTFDANGNDTRAKFERNDKYEELSGFKISNSIILFDMKWTGECEYQYSKFGVKITFVRGLEKYVYEYYLPSILIVFASILSFIIPLSAIPGRVGLVVTLFLTLTNMFASQRVCQILSEIYLFEIILITTKIIIYNN